jgi:sigma-B regulation protein RsbQ
MHGVPSRPALVLVHGFGCDQTMWGRLVPHLEQGHRVVTFDQAGAGAAGRAAYDSERHASLEGYAEDLVAICAELGLDEVVVVGHSIAAMIGVLAHLRAPELVAGLVMIAPSPRFVDEPPYVGGFSAEEVQRLLAGMRDDFRVWVETMSPAFVGHPEQPELAAELTAALLRIDPDIAVEFARVTFLSDNRKHLPAVQCPTLVIQVSGDPFVPEEVGEYVRDQLPRSSYTRVDTTGHFPHLSHPEETARAIDAFLGPIESFLRRTRGGRGADAG